MCGTRAPAWATAQCAQGTARTLCPSPAWEGPVRPQREACLPGDVVPHTAGPCLRHSSRHQALRGVRPHARGHEKGPSWGPQSSSPHVKQRYPRAEPRLVRKAHGPLEAGWRQT